MDTWVQNFLNVSLYAGGALALCAVIAALTWLLIYATNKRLVPVALLLIGFCLESSFGVIQPSMQLGLQIYPNDLISLFVLLSLVVGFIHRPLPFTESPFLLWLAFGAMIMLSFVAGLNEYGKYAGTEVRVFFYLWVAGAYCCAVDFDEAELRQLARWCVWAAYALMGIAAYYWIGVEAGFVNRQEVFREPDSAVFRPVGSHATFFVATVAMVQTMAWLRGTGTWRSGWHAAAFITFVTILQHRSVWISVAIGLLWVLLLERRHLPRKFPLLLGFVLSISLIISVAAGFGYLDDLWLRLIQSTLSMADSEGTFAARVDGWDRLLESWMAASTQVHLFGYPFGHGYTRMYNGVLIEFAPHNFFLDLLLRVGIIGTLLFLVPTCMAFVLLLRMDYASEFEYLLARGLGVCLLASMVYLIAYPSYYILGGATGVALAHIIRQRRARSRRQSAQVSPVRRTLAGRTAK